MYKFRDLTGMKFGKLTVISLNSRRKYHHYWNCICECGNECIIAGSNLVGGKTKSCGCHRKENPAILFSTHKQTNTKLYYIWINMKSRCYKKYNTDYHNYGLRGIKVCEEWQKFEPFYEWAMSNGYKEGLSIERIDVNKDYYPENCKWITMSEQAKNKRNTSYLTYNGITKRLVEWAKEFNIHPSNLRTRIICGWDIERALTVPKGGNKYA